MYSIKSLHRHEGALKRIFTNANGPSVLEECGEGDKRYGAKDISLRNYIKNTPALKNKDCEDFYDHYEKDLNNARAMFYRGWIEPQAIVVLNIQGLVPVDVSCASTSTSTRSITQCH